MSPDSSGSDTDFEELLLFLRESRAFDLTGYKRPTLIRRVHKRMHTVGVTQISDYLDHLQVHPEEFEQLFNTILINVTSFFRDKEAWDLVASEVVPQVLQAKSDPEEPIRCWCAGVASGEEAYSLAMVLSEAMGADAFRRRVKIYATDIDDEALAHARSATYAARELEPIAPELVARYFEAAGSQYVFRSELRRSLIFGRHDLVQDAPISRLDMLLCRNTLMYFTAETQAKVLSRLHYALRDGGFIFVGKAEMLLPHTGLFIPVDLRHRIFSKVTTSGPRDRILGLPAPDDGMDRETLGRHLRLLELAHESIQEAQLVIDASGRIVLVNERAREWFRLDSRDLRRPLQDLEISYRPAELRSLMEQAFADRRAVSVHNVQRNVGDGAVQYLDVSVAPLLGDPEILGASITFTDVTDYHSLQEDLQRSRQELEAAYEELQSTNEELETTNEELQSTVEELETTNEELQSSNEELETMNEELESTNSELQAINGELRQRSDEFEDINAFMESVLTSLRLGVAVVNNDLRVKMWHGKAEDLWGLRPGEVYDEPLMNLDVGLPLDQVKRLVQNTIGRPDEVHELLADAVNRRGRRIRCRIVGSTLTIEGKTGAVLLMEEVKDDGAER
ncbi:MAG TPA: CheR family methyltransferase [Candidatus Dormibacteraeota bacterium]|nr:CheR family methyltransferase [Candidatus Dormibacteraeota bacterium]